MIDSEQSILFTTLYEEAIMGLKSVRSQLPKLDAATTTILNRIKRGGKVLACGNGGSAAQAEHFVAELMGRYKINRIPLPAVSLCTDGPVLTCIANDFGSDYIFSRQVQGLGKPEDVLVVFSTSGRSQNIVEALEIAKKKGLFTISFLGRDGGLCKDLADLEIMVSADATARIQETHLFCIHYICEQIDEHYK